MKLNTELQKLQHDVDSKIVSVNAIPVSRTYVDKVRFENGSHAFNVQHIKAATLELIWDQWDSVNGVDENIISMLDDVCRPTNKLVDLLTKRPVEYLIEGSSVHNKDVIDMGSSLGDCLVSLFGSDTLFIEDKIGWLGDINIDLKPYFEKYYSHTHGVLALCTSYESFIKLYLKIQRVKIQPSNIDSLLQDINNINNGRTGNTATQEQIDKVVLLLESENNLEQGLLLVDTFMDTAMVEAMNSSSIVSKLLKIQDVIEEIESFNFMWSTLSMDLVEDLTQEIPYKKRPVLSWESYNTLTLKPYMLETIDCDWSNLPQELYNDTLKHVNGGRLPTYTIISDYYVLKGKRGSVSSSHKVALQYMLGKNLPKDVERYVEEGKEQGMDEGKAWAIAWSRYCKYKNPNSDHCKQEEYLPNQGKKQAKRIANTFEIQRKQ